MPGRQRAGRGLRGEPDAFPWTLVFVIMALCEDSRGEEADDEGMHLRHRAPGFRMMVDVSCVQDHSPGEKGEASSGTPSLTSYL